MSEKNNRYVIRGSKWVKKPMPNTKQTEEKPTNISIECTICSRMVKSFVRIVSISNEPLGVVAYLKGICCDRCIFTHKFNHGIYLINSENKVFTPETITVGQVIPTNDKGWLVDSTKETYYERLDKYRRMVANMRKINKAFGLIVPTFKEEYDEKIATVSYIDDDLKRAIYEKIKSGEIKIE